MICITLLFSYSSIAFSQDNEEDYADIAYVEESFTQNNSEKITPNELNNDLAQSLDPCEKYNRRIFRLNHELDLAIVKPTAKVYRALLSPQWARKRVYNFFNNLEEPRIMVNSLLQGDMANFFTSSFRFLVNSTLGLGGAFDVAGSQKVYSKKLGFGKTMQKLFNAPPGYYVVLPVIGPFVRREAVGWMLDVGLDPIDFFLPLNTVYEKLLIGFIVKREAFLDTTDDLDKISLDPYAMMRSIYIQQLKGEGGLNTIPSTEVSK